jgi:3-dehydroquinate synthase
VFEPLTIASHRGPYEARFVDDAFRELNEAVPARAHFIIDSRVASLYARELTNVLAHPSVLLIEATEGNKSLEHFPAYVDHLVAQSIRRGHSLIAIGGGILQDITCFLAATLLRGVDWHFYPTTLLAQADSCIGSKSSINCGRAKNILGTFTPPKSISISTRVLETLDERDLRSGVGEMLKVHAIDGPASFDRIASDYSKLFTDREVLMRYIRASLEIKKRIIEVDEFDQGVRNVMNYGHSFGHAIEAATDFAIPHGIAVTIGMDMANFVAAQAGRSSAAVFARMHPTMRANYAGFETFDIPLDRFLGAIAKDKKNTDTQLSLVLPDGDGVIGRVHQNADAKFRDSCQQYLAEQRER